MAALEILAALDALPRLGWVDAPTPVTPLPELAESLGLRWLGAKRDDSLPLLGGTKVRKLDRLLATAPFAGAPAWASAGAIGSGHLVALTAAARRLDRRVDAVLFWEPPSEGVLENLAYTASGPTEIAFVGTRAGLALRHPRVLLGPTLRGIPVVAPGASVPAAVVGIARAAVELVAQVEAGEVPPFDRIVVPLGSGGTAAGLALGLGLAGHPASVHAVAVVERWLAGPRRLAALAEATRRLLVQGGIAAATAATPAPIRIDRGWLGPGYGVPTAASRGACSRLGELGLALEPVYSGKAMAALLAARGAGDRVVFWVTPRRGETPPADPDWRERLPRALQRRLAPGAPGPSRRRLLVAGAAGAACVGLRVTGYPPLPAFRGQVLAAWEAHVVRAAAEALLPPAPGPYGDVAARVDRYLAALPPRLRRDVHALLATVEHATLLGGEVRRLTRLAPAEGEAWLRALDAYGGLARQAYRGIRDLCMLGHYQDPATWPDLGYGGPRVPPGRRPSSYDALAAPAGAIPPGWEAAP
ncbi:pyridoxal-phosphate dependent enzyme [Myxococcota bacterium]|nr:pyridoxal-phosphate dependent enzyme [Myxococcota bacterium]